MKLSPLFLLCAVLLAGYLKAEQTNKLCDNGLKDWLSETNHQFGYWCARSIRIVQTPTNTFYAQFRDCNETNKPWIGLFEGDKTYDDLKICQWHVRRAFEVRKGVVDAFEDIGKPH